MDHTMNEMILTIVASVIASSGFWAFIQRFSDKKSKQTKMLVGLAHDKIIYLGMMYIQRGWITHEEYENLNDYLYCPYKDLGGNGSAMRIMDSVYKLPMVEAVHMHQEDNKK